MKKYIFFILLSLFSVNAFAHEYFEETVNWDGDVRTIWRQVGKKGQLRNEMNAAINYEKEFGWVGAKVKFMIPDASSSDGRTFLMVDKCMLGYAFGSAYAQSLFLEVGRNKMDNLFESKLQFKSHFNGVHLAFQNDEWTIHGGPHIIDSYREKYGFIGEIKYTSPTLPVTLCYSLTHWRPGYPYTISQVLASYEIGLIGTHPLKAYGCFLRNHQYSNHSNGAYMGLTLGDAILPHDFKFDVNCQYVGINSVPRFDFNGIEKGWHVQCKAIYNLNNHIAFEGKMNFASDLVSEFTAIFKW